MTGIQNIPLFRDNPAWANRQMASAWESFVATGKFRGITPRPVIVDCWARCRSLGISPHAQRAPTQISVDEIEAVLAEAALGRAGREVLDGYARMVEGSGHVIVLADAAGRILYSVGLKGTRDQLERINFFPGGLWLEEIVGPNGVGTPLALGRAEVVFGTEHYCEGWQPWVCYGSPIRNPDGGDTIGVVDITGPARNAHLETLALTVAIAQAVQHRLQIAELVLRDTLRSKFRECERRWPGEGLLLISENGKVVDVNGEAV
ncbi:MAG: GAF domain-containing protein, partial [Chromatiales bacterium]